MIKLVKAARQILALGFFGALFGCASFSAFNVGGVFHQSPTIGTHTYNQYGRSAGYLVETKNVSMRCVDPRLQHLIAQTERHFGRPVVITSGFRSARRNRLVGGAPKSLHMKCQAVDMFIPGVPKAQLVSYLTTNRYAGGIGCYPSRKFVHVDVRKRPARFKAPVFFKGCPSHWNQLAQR